MGKSDMNTRSGLLFSFLILFAANISGCATKRLILEPDIKDGGLLTEVPCGPPCFYGIIPGDSSLEESKSALVKYGMINSCTIGKNGLYSIICGNNTLQIGFTKDYDYLSVIFFYLEPGIPIEDVISKYGEPEFVMQIHGGTPEHQNSSLDIYYPEYSMILTTSNQEGTEFYLGPTTLIESVAYSVESLKNDNNKQYWSGYGSYINK